MAGTLEEIPTGGFSFDNCKRNAVLTNQGLTLPKARSTGTTIVGLIYKDGVILGADTRATEGPIVADLNCSKIHKIANNIYCCGAGTAADTEMVTRMIESNMELIRLNTGRQPRVQAANRLITQYLFRYGGHVSAALVLGGVDHTGAYLFSVFPHGSSHYLPYVTMGSGSLAAMAVFESRYKVNMEKEEAKKLVHDAVAAGIFNDLGSGSNIDLCVITKEDVEYLRGYANACVKGQRQGTYDYVKGTTLVISESVEVLEEDSMGTEVEVAIPSEQMMVTA